MCMSSAAVHGGKPLWVCAETPPITTVSTRKNASRVYVLDIHPLCYNGSTPDPRQFAFWMQPFLTRIVLQDPVIAVFDGEGGNDTRKKMLPSYKSGRRRYKYDPHKYKYSRGLEACLPYIHEFLHKCNIPVVKVDNAEADDVIATLTEQIVSKNMKAIISSPDKDFKQLISENIQLVIPLPDLKRWSFYTLKDYVSHHKCGPSIELGLRCMLGDAADGVPGVPGFGRKTALKLIQKHGSIENLLDAAAVRTVGKPYIQDALKEHSLLLQNNLQILRLRRDVNNVVVPNDGWFMRDESQDVLALEWLNRRLEEILRR